MIAERIARIRERMAAAARRAGREPSEVKLVAVSKTVAAPKVADAIAAGIEILGENYIQEALDKHEALGERHAGAQWHFIGHLQTNKARYAARIFSLIHSVDRLKLAAALNREAEKQGKTLPALIQVNISGEGTKSGVAPSGLRELATAMGRLGHLSVAGLMTMPPFFDDPERARPFFAELRRLRDELDRERLPGVRMKELSMGMTGDFEAAIEEGATLVRIGTAIFGERA